MRRAAGLLAAALAALDPASGGSGNFMRGADMSQLGDLDCRGSCSKYRANASALLSAQVVVCPPLSDIAKPSAKSDDDQSVSRLGGDPRCSNASVADIQATGALNLLRFGAHGDSVTDDAAILRAAIGCHNRVFVPSVDKYPPKGQPSYLINSTIVIADADRCSQCASVGQNVQIRGVGSGKHPSSVLRTNSREPVLQIGDWSWIHSDGSEVRVEDLEIAAVRVGVYVVATSNVHLTRVAISVSEWAAEGPPSVTMPAEDHAALVVSDVYWLWITACNFVGATPPNYSGEHNSKIVMLSRFVHFPSR